MELIPTILRGLQLLWILILTALIGNVIATNLDGASSATAAINFTMFVIVVSWLVAIYGLATAFFDRLAIPLALLGANAAAMLFTFISAVVLAAKLGVVNCSNTAGHDADWIAYGSNNDVKRCREIQAGTVFMWFLFVTFTSGFVLAFLGGGFRRGGGSVMSGPTMSQLRV